MLCIKTLRGLLLIPVLALLSGCNAVLLSPSGDIAIQQRDLLVQSTILMLLIIVPVIVLTLLFAWRYRESNTEAVYDPEWHHSTVLELLIWAAPLIIIIALGAITWVTTHKLDPYQPLERIAEGKDLSIFEPPMTVEVVALDWKWLFIYPEQGIATVNELVAPVDRPIHFKITSSSVMNSLFIPALAGQIYAMPGMQTTLNAVINKPGEYEGFSGNYSGAGFSGMHFKFHGVSSDEFDTWVAQARKDGSALSRDTYLQLQQPSEREPVRHYAKVSADLYDSILNRCVEGNRMCMKDIAAIDARGGLGKAGTYNLASVDPATRDRLGLKAGLDRTYVRALCTPSDPTGTAAPQRL